MVFRLVKAPFPPDMARGPTGLGAGDPAFLPHPVRGCDGG